MRDLVIFYTFLTHTQVWKVSSTISQISTFSRTSQKSPTVFARRTKIRIWRVLRRGERRLLFELQISLGDCTTTVLAFIGTVHEQTSLFNSCAREGSEVGTNRPFKQRPGISGIPSVRSGKMERSPERRDPAGDFFPLFPFPDPPAYAFPAHTRQK